MASTVILRDYQKEILNAPAIADLRRWALGKSDRPKFTAPIVVSPTGTGKTAMFCATAKWYRERNLRTIVLTHRDEILRQTIKSMYKLDTVAGQIASGKPMTKDLIQVASVQTLVNRLGQVWKPDLIITDEAHHATEGNTWGRIHSFWGSIPRIGFSATPIRLDGVGLRESFDTIVLGPSIKESVDNGWLSMPIFYRPPQEEEVDFHLKRGDFDLGEQEVRFDVSTERGRKIVGNVIDHYKRHLNGAPTIVSCVSVDHAKLMADQFCQAGFRAVAVWGDMADADRLSAIDGLGTGQVQLVCFCELIDEGVDVPCVVGVILLRRTLSLGKFLQIVGRGLRPIFADGYPLDTPDQRKAAMAASYKPFAIILDHAGNYALHGHPLADRVWSLDSQKRPKGEKAPTTTTCPKCYGVWPGRPRSCPSCGHSFVLAEAEAKRQELVEIEGELVQAGLDADDAGGLAAMIARAQALTGADKQRMILGQAFALMTSREDEETRKRKVAALAAAVGYKRGWVDMVWELKIKRERQRA